MIKRKDIEIMAPVGSFESLQAAIQAGANSVYFGIQHLNMRAISSINFSQDDLVEIVKICREKGIKSYLTLNTILYDHDLGLMTNILKLAKDASIGAVILSDQSAILEAYSLGLEVHISTQLNISNAATLKFYAQWADVIVLARELNLSQVKKIHKSIVEENITGPSGKLVRLEMFAHGALCMAISGKCYLSLHENNASANRGACQQTCRKEYIVTEKESGYELEIDNEYIMSPKDLLSIHFLNKILDAGIRVLKIEGRARPAEYVHTVTSCYDEAVRAIEDKSYGESKIVEWKKRKYNSEGVINVKKHFELTEMGEGIYKDVENSSMFYLTIPNTLPWKVFEKMTIFIRNNFDSSNFDAALGVICLKEHMDVVRIFEKESDLEFLKKLRASYLEEMRKLNL